MSTLYFVTRTDLAEGLRTAQALHAMDEWTALHGPHQGTVIVYGVRSERQLLNKLPEHGRTVLWREPDLDNQATAFATDAGRMRLQLLRSQQAPTGPVAQR